jgi:hypothetical protein
MATFEVISWRDIPVVVEARDERESVTRQLSERFQMLVDSAAMQLGLEGSDQYLEEWTRSAPAERAGGAGEVADAVVAELEERFTDFIGRAFRR